MKNTKKVPKTVSSASRKRKSLPEINEAELYCIKDFLKSAKKGKVDRGIIAWMSFLPPKRRKFLEKIILERIKSGKY